MFYYITTMTQWHVTIELSNKRAFYYIIIISTWNQKVSSCHAVCNIKMFDLSYSLFFANWKSKDSKWLFD